jgi:hypothetical protein
MSEMHEIPEAVLKAPVPVDINRIDGGHLGTDIMRTVRQITHFYTGSEDAASMRRIFHILETSNFIPAIKGSGTWWLRKSTARATLWMHERRAWQAGKDEDLVRLNLLLNMLLQRLPANDNKRRNGEQDPLTAVTIEAAATIRRLLNTEAM